MASTMTAHGAPACRNGGAGRWCDVFEIRDWKIQRCFIYLDPDYAGKDTARYPWLEGRNSPRCCLAIDNLSKSYGSLVVTDSVSLSIAEGEALGIIGPNGAGKTTLFSLITGATAPNAGTIALDGKDITGHSAQKRCLAGICRSHQVPHPFEKLTVAENLLVAACFGQNKREADVVDTVGEILEQTGLAAKANRVSRRAAAARPQAAGDGARARHQPAPAAARRDRRRADAGRMRRVGRDDPRHPQKRPHDHLDRAHRERAGRGRRPAGRAEFRQADRRGRAARRCWPRPQCAKSISARRCEARRDGSALRREPRCLLRRLPGAVRHIGACECRRDRRHHRLQRRRQVDLPEDDHRHAVRRRARRALRGRGDRRAAGARHHEARHRHGAGGPPAVPVARRSRRIC